MSATSESVHIHTINFGPIEVPGDKVLHFKEGIPGFPEIRRFAVLEIEAYKPFDYLQSLDEPPVALLVINPFLVLPGYKFELAKSDMEDLKTDRTENVSIYTVATIPEDPEGATVNLMAPILVNEAAGIGKQVILHDSEYSVRHPLLRAAAASV